MKTVDPEHVFLSYQRRWLGDEAQVRVCEKSRRIGLSWAQAAECVLTASRARGGMETWYIGYNTDMAQEFIKDCAMWARRFECAASNVEEHLLEDEGKDVRLYRITFANKKRITALSSRPTNLRGKQGLVIIDEAAFHPELGELLKAALALLIWGGRVCIISTHNGVDNPFNELVEDIRKGKKGYSLHRITFKEALAAGLYRRIALKMGREWSEKGERAWEKEIRALYGESAREELDCIPRGMGGRWLSRALITSCMHRDGNVVRFSFKDDFSLQSDTARSARMTEHIATLAPNLKQLDPNLRSFLGADFARSGDLSVFACAQEEKDLRLNFLLIIELANCPFKQQEELLFHLIDHLPRFARGVMDARGNGQYLAEVALQRYGTARIEPLMLTAHWYRTHMPPLKAAFEDGKIALPTDADILADLRSLEVVNGIARLPEKRTTGSAGTKRHGDSAIAVALAHYAAREDVVPMEYRSVGRRHIFGALKDYETCGV